MQTFKVKSKHHWFSNGLILNLTIDTNGDKLIRFIGEKQGISDDNKANTGENQNLSKNNNLSEGRPFDPTSPEDIQTLFMFTGTSKDDLYCVGDEQKRDEKNRARRRDEKNRDIRKWIYSYTLKPGIKMIFERNCG